MSSYPIIDLSGEPTEKADTESFVVLWGVQELWDPFRGRYLTHRSVTWHGTSPQGRARVSALKFGCDTAIEEWIRSPSGGLYGDIGNAEMQIAGQLNLDASSSSVCATDPSKNTDKCYQRKAEVSSIESADRLIKELPEHQNGMLVLATKNSSTNGSKWESLFPGSQKITDVRIVVSPRNLPSGSETKLMAQRRARVRTCYNDFLSGKSPEAFPSLRKAQDVARRHTGCGAITVSETLFDYLPALERVTYDPYDTEPAEAGGSRGMKSQEPPSWEKWDDQDCQS